VDNNPKDGEITGTELDELDKKCNLAKAGDMWFINYSKDGAAGLAKDDIDHVGLVYTKVINGEPVYRIIEAAPVAGWADWTEKYQVRTSESNTEKHKDPTVSRYWNGEYKTSTFRGLRRKGQTKSFNTNTEQTND
jgi:hypothetical protein